MIVIMSDPHLQVGGMFAKPLPDGLSTRAQIGFDFLEWLGAYCKDNAVEAILCGGDLFTQKNAIPVPLFNRAHDILRGITNNMGVPIYAIPGNHDRYMKSNDPKTHSLYTLGEGIDRLHVITDPYQVYKIGRAHELIGIPAGVALPDYRLRKPTGVFRMLLIHENIIGASFPNGDFAQEGLDRVALLDFIERNLIDVCFCGDIHRPQLMRGKHEVVTEVETYTRNMSPRPPKIVVIGAPYKMDFGDEGQSRGVWVLDHNELGFLPYPDGPKFLTVTDENYQKEINRTRQGKWYFRFRVSKPQYREYIEELLSKGPMKDCSVAEFTSAVEGDEFTPTDIHNYRNLIGDYVMTVAELKPELRKQAGAITSMGLHYFDKAMEVMEQ